MIFKSAAELDFAGFMVKIVLSIAITLLVGAFLFFTLPPAAHAELMIGRVCMPVDVFVTKMREQIPGLVENTFNADLARQFIAVYVEMKGEPLPFPPNAVAGGIYFSSATSHSAVLAVVSGTGTVCFLIGVTAEEGKFILAQIGKHNG